MLKMSFMKGTLDKEEAKEIITNTKKDIRYTYGFAYRNPTTLRKLISKEEALRIINDKSYLDIIENEDFIHINAFSCNDMY